VERSAADRRASGDVSEAAAATYDRGEQGCSALRSGSAKELTEPRFEPEAVIAALNEGSIRYVVVGGLASGAHGVVRATRHVDLVPDPEAENLRRLAGILTALGARHPIQDDLTADNLAAPASIKLETRHSEVHVLNRMPGTPLFDELEAQEFAVEVAPGVFAPVCSLAHLRQMKRASDRPRDQVDLQELEELHGAE